MRRGVTLVELVLVILLTLVLAGLSIGELRGVHTWRAAAAVRRVHADLLHARHAALLSGRRTLWTYDPATTAYELRQEAGPASGPVDAELLKHPATGLAWQVSLSEMAPGLSIDLTPKLEPCEIGFATSGLPIQRSGAPLTADITLNFGTAGTLVVRAGSGLTEVLSP